MRHALMRQVLPLERYPFSRSFAALPVNSLTARGCNEVIAAQQLLVLRSRVQFSMCS